MRDENRTQWEELLCETLNGADRGYLEDADRYRETKKKANWIRPAAIAAAVFVLAFVFSIPVFYRIPGGGVDSQQGSLPAGADSLPAPGSEEPQPVKLPEKVGVYPGIDAYTHREGNSIRFFTDGDIAALEAADEADDTTAKRRYLTSEEAKYIVADSACLYFDTGAESVILTWPGRDDVVIQTAAPDSSGRLTGQNIRDIYAIATYRIYMYDYNSVRFWLFPTQWTHPEYGYTFTVNGIQRRVLSAGLDMPDDYSFKLALEENYHGNAMVNSGSSAMLDFGDLVEWKYDPSLKPLTWYKMTIEIDPNRYRMCGNCYPYYYNDYSSYMQCPVLVCDDNDCRIFVVEPYRFVDKDEVLATWRSEAERRSEMVNEITVWFGGLSTAGETER